MEAVSAIVPNSYPPRVKAFRDDMIKLLPRAPNTKASGESLGAMPTRSLIIKLVTWRMRLIPAKPRKVRIWSGGITPAEFLAAKPKLRTFLQKVEAGEDLTGHLSNLVKTKGVVLPGANPADRGKDIDTVLIRYGVHHFHIGSPTAINPKGRSNTLLFAEVLEKEFKIVAISDHRAFERGSPEQLRFFGICRSYVAKDVPPGQGFMTPPVLSSGHSMLVMGLANKCEDCINRLDPQLDDSIFIDSLYNGQPLMMDGLPIGRPSRPSLAWHFEDLQFGIIDKRTGVFFCIFPFFAR